MLSLVPSQRRRSNVPRGATTHDNEKRVMTYVAFRILNVLAAQFLPFRNPRGLSPASAAELGVEVTEFVTMRRSLSSEAPPVSTTPTSDGVPATGVSSLGSGGMTAGVGKAASALLAKHVRTLEVLHSLQRENARLRLEIQVNNTTDPCNRVAMRV